jgi:DNA-binding MarR family transcriptional regulator
MEKDNLGERKPSETDKRVMLIYLTEQGRKLKVG